jgi:2-iminobutanoate/2-iminopropanoate deaminase
MQFIATDAAPAAGGHYSQAVVHGGLVYVAGQLPMVPGASEVKLEGLEAQARQVIANVFAILEAAGSAREEIVRATVYLAGVEHWPAFNRVYAEMMGNHRPARSIVPVPALHYGYLVEMDAIAALRRS